MKVLVAGANGLVGRAVGSHCNSLGDLVLPYARQSLDITDYELVMRTVADQQPDVVINCAAWTDVDGCQSNSEKAFSVNAKGPENLAIACRAQGAGLITISTDYVFDGSKDGFYTQLDEPKPISVYGVSKLEGEQRASSAYPQTIVVRTGFVFGKGGRNFLSTVVERGRRGEKLQVINDAKGTPTFADDLAARLRQLAELRTAAVFHVVNSGMGATYEDFARLALEMASIEDPDIEPISGALLNRPAPRPANSCLRCLVSDSLHLPPMPDWKAAVRRFVGDQTPKTQDISGRLSTVI